MKLIDYAGSDSTSPSNPTPDARWPYLKLTLLIITLLFSSPGFTTGFDTREYTLKAVFLERFTRFIDWPNDKSADEKATSFVIGIIGNPDFSALLREIYQNQKIQGKNVIVKDLDNLESLQNTHLLFIADISDSLLENVLKQAQHTSILTVSDSEGFAERGVMINFFMSRKKKIRFEINEQAIKHSDLYISYKLLSIAKIVGGE
ncbi:MAG: YfiR family protein [Gammaproteobacteria bacterium]|nr:YfiR family protein [Gammaproteobacteria bacterium]